MCCVSLPRLLPHTHSHATAFFGSLLALKTHRPLPQHPLASSHACSDTPALPHCLLALLSHSASLCMLTPSLHLCLASLHSHLPRSLSLYISTFSPSRALLATHSVALSVGYSLITTPFLPASLAITTSPISTSLCPSTGSCSLQCSLQWCQLHHPLLQSGFTRWPYK